MDSNRSKSVLRPLYLLLVLSLVFAVLKLWAGFLADSASLRSVGFNNTADFLYGLILYLGLWVSIQPADSDHPEGHYRYESVVGVIVGFIILGSGVFVHFDALRTFLYGQEIKLSGFSLFVLLSSIGLKFLLAWHLKTTGKSNNSPALLAIGQDQFGDILADSTVIFALITSYCGWAILDPIIAVVIGLLILKIGFDTLRENLGHLTGQAAERKLENEFEKIIRNKTKFAGPTELKTHYVGPRLHLSFVLRAGKNKTLEELHAEEEKVRQRLLEHDLVERVYIHLEPINSN